jgi:hypothetical protein
MSQELAATGTQPLAAIPTPQRGDQVCSITHSLRIVMRAWHPAVMKRLHPGAGIAVPRPAGTRRSP